MKQQWLCHGCINLWLNPDAYGGEIIIYIYIPKIDIKNAHNSSV